jgi:hypothetical protein
VRFAHTLPGRRSTPTLKRMEFTALPLHDTILQTVAVHWPSATCRVLFEPVGVGQVQELAFAGVTELALPRQQPWGPSSLVNKVLEPEPGCFQLEMQSGDVIQVRASTWHYQRKT